MNIHDGYKKSNLTNRRILLAGGGDIDVDILHIAGKINLTSTTEIENAQSKLLSDGECCMYLITDSTGKFPSACPAVSIPGSCVRKLSVRFVNDDLLNIAISSISFSDIGANVGDLVIIARVGITVGDLKAIYGSIISGNDSDVKSIYSYKIIATQDAKPTNFSSNGVTVSPGVSGLESPWDKVLINKIPDIEYNLSRKLTVYDNEINAGDGDDIWPQGLFTNVTSGRTNGAASNWIMLNTGGWGGNAQLAIDRGNGALYSRVVYNNWGRVLRNLDDLGSLDYGYTVYQNSTGSYNFTHPLSIRNLNRTVDTTTILSVGGPDDYLGTAYFGFVYKGQSITLNFATIGIYNLDYIINATAAGNVGIGTTSPNYKLTVAGDIEILGDFSNGSSDARYLYFGEPLVAHCGVYDSLLHLYGNEGVNVYGNLTVHDIVKASSVITPLIEYQTTTLDRYRIVWSHDTSLTSISGITLPRDTSTLSGSLIIETYNGESAGIVISEYLGITVFSPGDGGYIFRVFDEDSPNTNLFSVNSSGGVSIGTTSNNYKLHVNGTIGGNGVFTNISSSTSNYGLSLYSNNFNIGIMYRSTASYGKLGAVLSDAATYFTMTTTSSYPKRGWIFRNSTNSTDVASISTLGEAYFNTIGNNYHVIYSADGKFVSTSNAYTGAIQIAFPTAGYQNNCMIKLTIEIYNYVNGTSSTYIVGCYTYLDGLIYLPTAYSLRQGINNFGNLSVRFGRDTSGTRNIIWIGETTTTWSYPQVWVKNISLGYSGANYNIYSSGWEVSIVSAFGTVDSTITNPAVNNVMGTVILTTAAELNGSVGSFFFAESTGLINSGYDTAGILVYSEFDKWQITAMGSLLWRQNDTGGTNTSWGNWRVLLDSSNWSNYITSTRNPGTATSLTSLDITKTFIYATISSNMTLGLSADMEVGQEITILVYNNGSSAVTITVPSTWKSLDAMSLTLINLCFVEISILCYSSLNYMVSYKLQ